VAAVLAGAWRAAPPAWALAPAALAGVAPLLAAGGAGGLAWWRLRHAPAAGSPAGRELRQHYRLQALRAADREAAVAALFVRLRAAGVEPVLVKGSSSALLYPEPGLRPSGDIDLCVRADRLGAAAASLAGHRTGAGVDLHADFPDLPGRRWADVLARTRLVGLGGVGVRVLGAEDQLRLLCLHLARHGAARPLWLCDVAALLESLPRDFDWELCLDGPGWLAGWVRCVVTLARRLLGARPAGPVPGGEIPGWLAPAVLWCWGGGAGRRAGLVRLRYQGFGTHPGVAPVKAALQLGLGPGPLPLVLVQLAAFVRRKVPHVLGRLLRRRRVGQGGGSPSIPTEGRRLSPAASSAAGPPSGRTPRR
jgi:hypothetical protein